MYLQYTFNTAITQVYLKKQCNYQSGKSIYKILTDRTGRAHYYTPMGFWLIKTNDRGCDFDKIITNNLKTY